MTDSNAYMFQTVVTKRSQLHGFDFKTHEIQQIGFFPFAKVLAINMDDDGILTVCNKKSANEYQIHRLPFGYEINVCLSNVLFLESRKSSLIWHCLRRDGGSLSLGCIQICRVFVWVFE